MEPDRHIPADRPLARNHARVFEALKEAGRPMTAYEIIDAVRGAGISAPPTVYRALARLTEAGLAHRLESLNAFIACSHEGPHGRGASDPIAFAICESCENAQELCDPALTRELMCQVAERGFAVNAVTIELRGKCQACQSRQEPT